MLYWHEGQQMGQWNRAESPTKNRPTNTWSIESRQGSHLMEQTFECVCVCVGGVRQYSDKEICCIMLNADVGSI